MSWIMRWCVPDNAIWGKRDAALVAWDRLVAIIEGNRLWQKQRQAEDARLRTYFPWL